jgi:hypothetical protein
MTTLRWSRKLNDFIPIQEWWETDGRMTNNTAGRSDFPCPTVIGDIPEYTSPIDGRPITSRSERREDLKRNGCVEYEPSVPKRYFRNERWARKRGALKDLHPEIRERIKA